MASKLATLTAELRVATQAVRADVVDEDELLDPDMKAAQAWAKERIQALVPTLRQASAKGPRQQVEGMANAMFSMVGIMKNLGKASPALASKVQLYFRNIRGQF